MGRIHFAYEVVTMIMNEAGRYGMHGLLSPNKLHHDFLYMGMRVNNIHTLVCKKNQIIFLNISKLTRRNVRRG